MGIREDYIILDNNGIGYRIYTSKNSLLEIEIGGTITIYIYFNLREDGIYLYGFITEEELHMFNMLLLVSRIGPKVGLGILSALTPNQIKLAILSKDYKALCNAPGIGKKTAERIILELKDRIEPDSIIGEPDIMENNEVHIAISGLISLGYTRGEIMKALNNIGTEGLKAESIIRSVLNKLSKQ